MIFCGNLPAYVAVPTHLIAHTIGKNTHVVEQVRVFVSNPRTFTGRYAKYHMSLVRMWIQHSNYPNYYI